MSWHYLQEQEAESWEGDSLDGAPDALLRLMPTLEASSCPDKEMGSSSRSQSGTTSTHSTEDPGDRQLMLFQEDSHVKTSALRVSVKDLPESVLDYGAKCLELLERFGLGLSLRKTVRTCVSMDSAPLSKNLPRWGMSADGACWELGTSAHPIRETGCGYLPTPTANQTWKSNKGGATGKKDGKWIGKKRLTLAGMAESGEWGEFLATPTAKANQLSRSMMKWPGCRAWVEHSPTVNQVGGPLNPMWVEWLMGWPIGWTDLSQLETDKFRLWLLAHSECCPKGGYDDE